MTALCGLAVDERCWKNSESAAWFYVQSRFQSDGNRGWLGHAANLLVKGISRVRILPAHVAPTNCQSDWNSNSSAASFQSSLQGTSMPNTAKSFLERIHCLTPKRRHERWLSRPWCEIASNWRISPDDSRFRTLTICITLAVRIEVAQRLHRPGHLKTDTLPIRCCCCVFQEIHAAARLIT